MAFGRACASAPRAAGKPLAEASSTLANRACLIRGADGDEEEVVVMSSQKRRPRRCSNKPEFISGRSDKGINPAAFL